MIIIAVFHMHSQTVAVNVAHCLVYKCKLLSQEVDCYTGKIVTIEVGLLWQFKNASRWYQEIHMYMYSMLCGGFVSIG